MKKPVGFKYVLSVWMRMAIPLFILALMSSLLSDTRALTSAELKERVRDMQNRMYSLYDE